MYLLIAIGCCLLAYGTAVPLDVAAVETSDTDAHTSANNTELAFGDVAMLYSLRYGIFHLAVDKYDGPGGILVAWGASLKNVVMGDSLPALTRKPLEKVTGSIDNRGYQDGSMDDARFTTITSFYQLSRTEVVIVDQLNYCLRHLDRSTGVTSHYVGVCQKTGFADGDANTAMFHLPSHVFLDERDGKALLLLDDFNNALRSIDIATRRTTTLFNNINLLPRPRFATFDSKDKNILYISAKFKILKMSLSDNKITVISGVNKGFADGPFSDARFSYRPSGIVQLDENHLAVADYWNNDIRLIDLVDKSVTSLCTHLNYSSPAHPQCSLTAPHALMLRGNSLIIGDVSHIYKIDISSIPFNGQSAVNEGCETRTIRAMIAGGDTRAMVNVEDNVLELSAGSHRFMYQVKGLTCTVNIEVTDSAVRRRVEFELNYKYSCIEYNTNVVSNKLVSDRVENNFATILELCNGVCKRQSEADPVIVCENDTLTVTYPTDLSYGADILDVPSSVAQTLANRLVAKGAMMSIIDPTRIPPAVFPIAQKDGSSAKLVLTSFCMDKYKVYYPDTDSCN